MKSKQVIVLRKDLKNAKGEKVRSGKLCSQAAHASLKVIIDLMRQNEDAVQTQLILDIKKDSALNDWIKGHYTKISVSVNSEAELLQIYNTAKESGLICSLITDAGFTEFEGIPTLTAVAIGPAWENEVDAITGKLPLL